jgi:hypothetical protein
MTVRVIMPNLTLNAHKACSFNRICRSAALADHPAS